MQSSDGRDKFQPPLYEYKNTYPLFRTRELTEGVELQKCRSVEL